MKIFLLGLPGSGKSTLGKELSHHLRLPLVDLDAEIEKKAGKKIKDLFSSDGEKAFRQMESSLLKQWCKSQGSFIMATGGGTPCFEDNIKQIKASGISFFLDVPVTEIVKRMTPGSIDDRPLLSEKKQDLFASIENLRKQRLSTYQLADHIMKGAAITAQMIERQLSS